eukprot:CAMPEP_0184732780 /NCGR_PEP_ID=MMETSP0314-20130426/55458_1 /TAXON_ID=38298 /ORGANISM="Rhodella maculata, Strain CCMP 736" /LENGTH=44 /DNA_ID= /DNA_START= /DNA_END= /DNA_ORIENTATION=
MERMRTVTRRNSNAAARYEPTKTSIRSDHIQLLSVRLKAESTTV